ncbi:MAG: tail fiber domain-containing protein [Parcubacteria group bacterium]|nr:tail fiber domain-containing protein [Parcubacteria group bacterium]
MKHYSIYSNSTADTYFAGNVGIGTTTPGKIIASAGATLGLSSSSGQTSIVLENATGANKDWEIINSSSAGDYQLYAETGQTRVVTYEQDGSVFFPSAKTTGEDVAACFIASTGELIEDNTTTCASSSKRYKEDIQPLTYGLKEILQLKPVSFKIKSSGRQAMGLIAEDVELVIPELVAYDAEGRVDTLHFYDFIGPTIKAIQEQQEQIDAIRASLGIPGDIAEWYAVTEDPFLRPGPGDVAALTEELITFEEPLFDRATGNATGERVTRIISAIAKATKGTKQYTIGVISENPYLTVGKAVKDAVEHREPVALSGRVPVKISLENGPIRSGDLLTISSTPGTATKLVGSGQVIGRALEPSNRTGKVMMLVDNYYHYDEAGTVRIFDTKIIDLQGQIDSLKARVESLEAWRAKKEHVMLEGGVPAD